MNKISHISVRDFFEKFSSLKSLRLLNFSIFSHEIFRIGVKLNFELNLLLLFTILSSKKFGGQIQFYTDPENSRGKI